MYGKSQHVIHTLDFSEHIYEAIFPLRLVTEAINKSDTWLKLMNLQHHCEVRLHSPDWKIFHEKVRSVYVFIRRLDLSDAAQIALEILRV